MTAIMFVNERRGFGAEAPKPQRSWAGLQRCLGPARSACGAAPRSCGGTPNEIAGGVQLARAFFGKAALPHGMASTARRVGHGLPTQPKIGEPNRGTLPDMVEQEGGQINVVGRK